MLPRIYFSASFLAFASISSAQAGMLYQNNFNSNNGGLSYVHVSGATGNPWTYGAAGGVANSGAWYVNGSTGGLANHATQALVSGNFVSTGGTVTIQFEHRFNFEAGYDGGALFVSINGGAYNYVTNSDFTQNGYTHTLSSSFNNDLGGLGAFSGGSPTSAFITSIANLGVLNANDTISFAFVGGWDSSINSGGEPDWVIDNIRLTDTGAGGLTVPAPTTLLLGLVGIGVTSVARWRRQRRVRK